MPRTLQKTSFIGGEISPAFNGRVDTQRYYESCQTLQNFIVNAEGGISNRPGTEYCGDLKTSTVSGRLIPFINSTTQAYVLEFGHLLFRVWKDGVLITAAGSGGDITTVFPSSVLFELNFTQNADTMYITHESYIPQKITSTADDTWVIGGIVLGPDPALDVPTDVFVSGGTTPYNYVLTAVDHDGVESDASCVNPGDTNGALGWIPPENGAPAHYRVYRQADVAANADAGTFGWIADITGDNDGSPGYTNVTALDPVITDRPPDYVERDRLDGTAKDITAYTTADPVVVSCDGHGFAVGDYIWITGVEGSTMPSEISERRHVITAIDTASSPDTFTLGYVDGDDYVEWDSGGTAQRYYNKFTGSGYSPAVCAWYQQRLIFAASGNKPHTIWGSNTGHSDMFMAHSPVADDDSYEHELDATTQNAIVGIIPLGHLLVFTSSSEWIVSGASSGAAITPTSINAKVQSNYGSASIRPMVIGDNVLFVQYGAKKIRQLAYSTEASGYRGNEITVLASHLFKDTTIVDWAYQREPNSVVWAVLDSGVIAGLSYQLDSGLVAWHRHVTDGTFESICVVPDGDGNDDLYVTVNRTIDGSTERYLEKFMPRMEDSDITDAYFVDSGVTVEPTAVTISTITKDSPARVTTATTHGVLGLASPEYVYIDGGDMTEISGKVYRASRYSATEIDLYDAGVATISTGSEVDSNLYTTYTTGGTSTLRVSTTGAPSHLVGETVSAIVDGHVQTGLTVAAGGWLTLNSMGEKAHIGLPYTSICETTDFVFKGSKGTIRDKCKQIPKVTLELEDTTALEVGPDADNLQTIPFRTTEAYDAPIAPYTGKKEVLIEPGDGEQSSVYIKNDKPAPVTVLGIMPQIEVGEG